MPTVTRKLQITVPKRLAEQVGIGPGSEVEFSVAGDAIRMAPVGKQAQAELGTAERLRLFREASARQAERDAAFAASGLGAGGLPADRGWTRDDLYTRR
jgi:AbrB family looped-hinge helix DNA binding protein